MARKVSGEAYVIETRQFFRTAASCWAGHSKYLTLDVPLLSYGGDRRACWRAMEHAPARAAGSLLQPRTHARERRCSYVNSSAPQSHQPRSRAQRVCMAVASLLDRPVLEYACHCGSLGTALRKLLSARPPGLAFSPSCLSPGHDGRPCPRLPSFGGQSPAYLLVGLRLDSPLFPVLSQFQSHCHFQIVTNYTLEVF